MKRTVVTFVALALTLVLAACGNSPAKQAQAAAKPGQAQIDLSLDWTPNPDHVGLYYAQSKGLFQQAGLTVRMRAPSDPSAPLKLVALRKADLAISYEPDLFFAAAKHLPVTAVAALIPVPLNSLIALPTAGISTPASLKGHTVGITGIPSYDELVVVANTTRLHTDPTYATTVRRFLATMISGISAARADQPGAITVMTKATTYTPKFLQASVPTTLNLLTPPANRPIGCLDQSAWQHYGDWMHATGLLKQAISATTVMTTAYLPTRC